jgi:hypothetical protein
MILNKHNQFTDGCILSFTQLLTSANYARDLETNFNSVNQIYDMLRFIDKVSSPNLRIHPIFTLL